MGQQEVYDLLKNKRLSGEDRFFSIADVRKMALNCKSDTNSLETISKSLARLHFWGLLERKNFCYRFKKSRNEDSLI